MQISEVEKPKTPKQRIRPPAQVSARERRRRELEEIVDFQNAHDSSSVCQVSAPRAGGGHPGDYVVLVLHHSQDLVEAVRNRMRDGWACQGGVSSHRDGDRFDNVTVWSQAMVRAGGSTDE